jgi:hypothetical protein
MQFVKLVISPTQRYSYKDASNIEMNILGDFLASDVGYRPLPFRQWIFDNTSQNANGSLTALQKDADYIVLTDIFTEEESPAELKMSPKQFVQILTDWQEKVCNARPQAIIIKHENDQFVIEETTITNETEKTAPLPHPTITPHLYPLWIKFSFISCCTLFLLSLLDFRYYFTLNKKVQKARTIFEGKNYPDAAIYFKKLSKKLPTNTYMKRYLAQSLFKSDDIEDHIIALNSLSNIKFKKREWQELLNYMPTEYIEYFQDVKRNRT